MTNSADQTLLMVFLKWPEAGRVKTRLARKIGEKAALDIYRKLLEHTRAVAVAVDTNRQAWIAPTDHSIHWEEWGRPQFDRHDQPPGHLGEKMQNAFKHGFSSGYNRIVIIGSDCPTLQPSHIEQAFRELRHSDVVLGPSRDGGYYLLGLNRYRPRLFEEMPWSRPGLYDKTLSMIEEEQLSLKTLEELNDIDTAADLAESRNSGVTWL